MFLRSLFLTNSGDFPFVWDEIKIPVKYGSDRVLAKTVILDSAIGIVGDYTKSAKEMGRDDKEILH